jgi:hypothetical protein
VIEVRVRQEDVADRQAMAGGSLDELAGFVAGINQDALAGFLASDHVAVLEKGVYRSRFDNHVGSWSGFRFSFGVEPVFASFSHSLVL